MRWAQATVVVPRAIWVSRAFGAAHPALLATLQTAVGLPGSKWQLVSFAEAKKKWDLDDSRLKHQQRPLDVLGLVTDREKKFCKVHKCHSLGNELPILPPTARARTCVTVLADRSSVFVATNFLEALSRQKKMFLASGFQTRSDPHPMRPCPTLEILVDLEIETLRRWPSMGHRESFFAK